MKRSVSSACSWMEVGRGIVLVIGSFGLSQAAWASESCPAGAVAPGVRISVTAHRADGSTPIGSGSVVPGETIVLRTCIYHVAFDPQSLDPLSAVEQGSLTISFNGSTTDVTPESGIPVVGSSCDGVMSVPSRNLAYMITGADASAGAIMFRADYTDGVAHLSEPVPVHVTSTTQVRVVQPQTSPVAGRLRIQKSPEGTLLQFTGQVERTYRVEASSNLADWSLVGTVSPDAAGLCQMEDADANLHTHRFYRYATEN